MAITVPDDPRLATATERRVWAALSEQLGDGDLVIASQRPMLGRWYAIPR